MKVLYCQRAQKPGRAEVLAGPGSGMAGVIDHGVEAERSRTLYSISNAFNFVSVGAVFPDYATNLDEAEVKIQEADLAFIFANKSIFLENIADYNRIINLARYFEVPIIGVRKGGTFPKNNQGLTRVISPREFKGDTIEDSRTLTRILETLRTGTI